jgi:hypothetical protein
LAGVEHRAPLVRQQDDSQAKLLVVVGKTKELAVLVDGRLVAALAVMAQEA